MHSYKIKKVIPLMPFMFFDAKKKQVVDSSLEYKDNEGNGIVLNIDPFASQPFMINENGFIMSDVMVFENAQSDSVARAVLARIKTVNSDSLPSDMPVEECFKHLVPSNCSTPAEYINLSNKVGRLAARELLEKQELEKEKVDKIDFTETETPKSE